MSARSEAELARHKADAAKARRHERRKQREHLRRVATAQDARLIELADERASGPFVAVSLDDLTQEG